MITFKMVKEAVTSPFSWILGARSGKWAKLRNDFIAKNGACSACGTTKDMTVHHIIPVAVDESRELDESNLITLCRSAGNCHFVFGHLHSFTCWNPNVVHDCKEHLAKVRARPCQPKD